MMKAFLLSENYREKKRKKVQLRSLGIGNCDRCEIIKRRI
jgi:hypothetical protein